MTDPAPDAGPPPSSDPLPPSGPRHGRGSLVLASFLVVIGVFVLVFRLLAAARLDRSAAMFIGVPMLIGVFAATAQPKGAVGLTAKYITVCMCGVAPLLGEGAVCLFMTAPIVYPLALLVAWLVSRLDRHKGIRGIVIIPFLHAGLAQTSPEELPVVELSDSIDIDAPRDQVFAAMGGLSLPLDRPPPLFLRAGFPTPIALVATGPVAEGSVRRVRFDNGTVVARIVAVVPGQSLTVALSYENPGHEFFDRWLILDSATFTFASLAGGRTRVTHTTQYRRLLEPAFYFGPLEEYGVHTMQRYLLEMFADYVISHPSSSPSPAS